jgi:hypothetical protein
LCLECGFVADRRLASFSSARLPKPKVAGSRPVVRFSGFARFPGRARPRHVGPLADANEQQAQLPKLATRGALATGPLREPPAGRSGSGGTRSPGRGHDLGGQQVVDREAVLANEEPDAAAQRDPADADGAGVAEAGG